MIKNTIFATVLSAALTFPFSLYAQPLVPPADIPSYVQKVQSSDDYRVNELQEQIRRLNGKVEELNFLLLQMQEKLRRMEEENEGRFQELEERQSSLPQGSKDLASNEAGGDNRLGKLKASEEAQSSDVITKPSQTVLPQTEPQNKPKPSITPRALGTLTFDKNGNVQSSHSSTGTINAGAQDGELSSFNIFGDATEGALAASEFGATPNEVFQAGIAAYEARQYQRSLAAFQAHIKAWPKDPKVGEARHYLAQSLFWQKKYYQAAEIQLETHNTYPEVKTAADNLLGLGLSLAGLNQREVACATYAEVLNQYPTSAARLGEQIKDEQAATKC